MEQIEKIRQEEFNKYIRAISTENSRHFYANSKILSAGI